MVTHIFGPFPSQRSMRYFGIHMCFNASTCHMRQEQRTRVPLIAVQGSEICPARSRDVLIFRGIERVDRRIDRKESEISQFLTAQIMKAGR